VETSASDDPSTEREDQATLLRAWNEDRRRNVTAFRMRPARQGLDTNGAPILQIDDRLVGKRQQVMFDGFPKVGFKFLAGRHLRLHRGLEQGIGSAARDFGA